MINNPAKQNRSSGIYFLTALGLLSVLAFTFFFCIAGFFLKVKISWWQFPLGCLAALPVCYYAARSLNAQGLRISFLKSTASVIALVAVSVLVSGYFYDVSFDGQWYHQESVYRLKQGYNPVYQTIVIPPNEAVSGVNNWCAPDPQSPQAQAAGQPVVNMKYLALNYLSKGTERMAAAIYGFTGRIETGKAVNLLMLFATFFLCLSALYLVGKIKPPFKWLLAIILAFNPVTSNELFSFCVDGFGGCALLSLLSVFALILLGFNRWYLFILFAIIIITVNVKATMLAFTVLLCAGFLLVLLLQKGQRYLLKPVLITCLVAGTAGVFIFGFNPYITTYMRQHSLFYGLADVKNEIDRLMPVALHGHNRVEKLLYSVSAHQGWSDNNTRTFSQLAKTPFTINKTDLLESMDIEAPLSGFGPFYSGALIIALIALTIAGFSNIKSTAFKFTGITLLVLMVTVMIVPDNWWSRFVPQMWLLPVVILLMLWFINFKGSTILRGVLVAALVLNVLWGALILPAGILNNVVIDHQLDQLKALDKPVYLEYCNYRCFTSNRVRLTEAGIPLSTQPMAGDDECAVPFSTTRIETPGKLPEVPESFLYKLRERLAPHSK